MTRTRTNQRGTWAYKLDLANISTTVQERKIRACVRGFVSGCLCRHCNGSSQHSRMNDLMETLVEQFGYILNSLGRNTWVCISQTHSLWILFMLGKIYINSLHLYFGLFGQIQFRFINHGQEFLDCVCVCMRICLHKRAFIDVKQSKHSSP